MSGPMPKKPGEPSIFAPSMPRTQATAPAMRTAAAMIAGRLLPFMSIASLASSLPARFRRALSDYTLGAKLRDVRVGDFKQSLQDVLRVLPERRRRQLVRDRRLGEAHRAAYQRHFPRERMRQLESQAARDRLRLGEHLLDGVDRAVRHAAGLERLDPFARAAPGEEVGERARELDPVLDALAVRSVARVLRETLAFRHLAELAELAVVAAGDDHVAVRGLERLVGHDVGMRVAQALGRDAGGEIVRAL